MLSRRALFCGAMGLVLGVWGEGGPWLVLLGWFEGVSSLSGGLLGLFTIVCGFLCGVGVLWGLLLVFTIRVSFWWLRLLDTSRGGVVVAVRGFRCGAWGGCLQC